MLLDITADDRTLYKATLCMQEFKIFSFYCAHLLDLLLYHEEEITYESCLSAKGQKYGYSLRYKDLMIGILLNITCNVEESNLMEYYIKCDIINILTL